MLRQSEGSLLRLLWLSLILLLRKLIQMLLLLRRRVQLLMLLVCRRASIERVWIGVFDRRNDRRGRVKSVRVARLERLTR